jgi:hypothetical protein
LSFHPVCVQTRLDSETKTANPRGFVKLCARNSERVNRLLLKKGKRTFL